MIKKEIKKLKKEIIGSLVFPRRHNATRSPALSHRGQTTQGTIIRNIVRCAETKYVQFTNQKPVLQTIFFERLRNRWRQRACSQAGTIFSRSVLLDVRDPFSVHLSTRVYVNWPISLRFSVPTPISSRQKQTDHNHLTDHFQQRPDRLHNRKWKK
jgi:hypothetical protein